jgi:hypothetical protein
MVFLTAGFARVFLEKRLELKRPQFLSFRPPLKALQIEPFLKKNSRRTAEPRLHREGTDPLLKIL